MTEHTHASDSPESPGETPPPLHMTRATARALTLAGAGLVIVITLMFISYTSGFGNPRPRDIPIAVVSSAALAAQLDASPALHVRRVDSAARARELVLHQDVYGAMDFSAGAPTLFVANGAGHSVEAALKGSAPRWRPARAPA